MCNLRNSSPYGFSMSTIDNALYNALMADFKPSSLFDATPESSPASQSARPVPTSYGVNNDLSRLARETVETECARDALENIADGLAEAKDAVEDRRLIEKALKNIAKLERRNIAIRRFSLAYRAISGGSMQSVAGVEYGGSGKVHLAGTGYPFGNTHDSLDSLRRAALSKGYYVAVSYVDKD